MYLDGARQQIIAWLEQGVSEREIARRLRVTPTTVRYWRGRNGIERPAKADEKQRKTTMTKNHEIRDFRTPARPKRL